MKAIYDEVSHKVSFMLTQKYSTSFSLGIMLLDAEIKRPIYDIYGFVRLADEIVDSFHDYNKEKLFEDFIKQTYQALDEGFSLNPILNSFQRTIHEYQIERHLIDTFLRSMKMDLNPMQELSKEEYEEYILGSAEVVGLMCLRIFCRDKKDLHDHLRFHAMKLGSAFQKINFLRDLKADYHELGRVYFPEVNITEFNDETKKNIEKDIELDFRAGYEGIVQLPKKARFGVYLAYVYYYSLFQKIKTTRSQVILNNRVRIPNHNKYGLIVSSYLKHSLNLL